MSIVDKFLTLDLSVIAGIFFVITLFVGVGIGFLISGILNKSKREEGGEDLDDYVPEVPDRKTPLVVAEDRNKLEEQVKFKLNSQQPVETPLQNVN